MIELIYFNNNYLRFYLYIYMRVELICFQKVHSTKMMMIDVFYMHHMQFNNKMRSKHYYDNWSMKKSVYFGVLPLWIQNSMFTRLRSALYLCVKQTFLVTLHIFYCVLRINKLLMPEEVQFHTVWQNFIWRKKNINCCWINLLLEHRITLVPFSKRSVLTKYKLPNIFVTWNRK